MSTEFKLYDVEEKNLYSKKSKAEKKELLYDMVMYALKYGNKPAARFYNTYPSTVRRWVNKYKEYGKDGLKFK